MTILVDMGGTYVRFGLAENGAPVRIKKYEAAAFDTFEAALAAYANETGQKPQALRIATAAHPDAGNVWRFVNRNQWAVDLAALARDGWTTEMILNDFEAAAWGLESAQVKELKRGTGIKGTTCLIGPGTGLGLAFMREHAAQGTMGGHIPTAAVTAEQQRVLQAVQKIKPREGIVVYEDVVSGPGLLSLYRARCALGDEKPEASTPEEMIAHHKSRAVQDALRLFHEFFGLFAANATVTGHSFGGLYLTGGVIDRLMEKNIFNFTRFENFFTGGFVPAVRQALDRTPVLYVTDPYLALHGLIRSKP